MQKIIFSLAVVSLFNFLVQSSHAQEPIVIKFPHVAAENTPKGQMAIKFKELVAKRLGGKVIVEVYPEGRLYDDNNVLEAMLLGEVQMAAPSVSKFGPYCPELQVFDLPFLFADRKSVARFQQSAQAQAMLDSLAAKGLLGLGYLNDNFKVFSASKPLKNPSDASGLRFRIQPSKVLEEQFNILGATSIMTPFSILHTLSQDKAIDGQENTWANILTRRIYTQQPYITVSNHGVTSFLIVTSATFWQNLEAPVRRELQQALQEAMAYGNDLAETINTRARQEISESHFTKIIELSDTERSLWKSAMTPVWHKFDRVIGKELIAAAYLSN